MYFSICIPTYNRAHTISRTLDSLVRQSYKDFEALVIDDGSKDNTEEVVEKYIGILSIKYIKKNNGGKHTALN
jgi:glycosyltransferase involved in cell wall biosynthesis